MAYIVNMHKRRKSKNLGYVYGVYIYIKLKGGLTNSLRVVRN